MWYQRHANKYGAKKTVWNGRKYDSKLEAGVAQEVEVLRKAGEVVSVEPQRTFVLHGKNGGKICSHRVDFLLTFKDGHQEVWEAKGFVANQVWPMKRKLFEDEYPEIKYVVITSKQTYYYGKQNNRKS